MGTGIDRGEGQGAMEVQSREDDRDVRARSKATSDDYKRVLIPALAA